MALFTIYKKKRTIAHSPNIFTLFCTTVFSFAPTALITVIESKLL